LNFFDILFFSAETTSNPDVEYRHLDLSALSSVRRFAADIINSERRLDILVNNAGVESLF